MAVLMLQLPTVTSMGRPTSRAVIAYLPDGVQERRIQLGVGGRSVFTDIKKTQGYKCHHKASARISLGGHLTAPPSLPTTCLVKGRVLGVEVRAEGPSQGCQGREAGFVAVTHVLIFTLISFQMSYNVSTQPSLCVTS